MLRALLIVASFVSSHSDSSSSASGSFEQHSSCIDGAKLASAVLAVDDSGSPTGGVFGMPAAFKAPAS